MKLAVDLTDHVSANVKVCYGCHGFEADMAYFDLRVGDELNFRVGRFSPSFGAFNLRHDPANHKLADKPLPYDMGRDAPDARLEPRRPAEPLPRQRRRDRRHALVRRVGARSTTPRTPSAASRRRQSALDLDFVQSHSGSLYYVDNNSRPAGGGAPRDDRASSGRGADLTLGASGMYGTVRPAEQD